MDEEGIFYLAFCLVVLLIAVSQLPQFGRGLYLFLSIAIIGAGAVLILMLNFADFIVVSFLFGFLGITFQPAKDYTIVKNQDAIIKDVNGLFYATGYITANLFTYTFKLERSEGEEEAKMMSAPENWERAIMNVGFPFKYHVLASGLDPQKVRDEFEGRRSYQEYQLSRALQNPNTANTEILEIQRKINVIQRKIDMISQGEKPIATVMYLETTAIGVSEKAALDTLALQINGLQIALSALDVDLTRVSGRELYTLFNFNFAIPTTFLETMALFDQQI
jgi:hypothetical protein